MLKRNLSRRLFSVIILTMAEKKLTPSSRDRISRILATYTRTEEKFSEFSRRNLILLIAGVGIGCIALGVLFAFIFSPYKQTAIPGTSSSASDSNQLASHSGIVRRVEDVDGGVSYYLEKSDETRLLLRSSKIDLSFFEGSSVTAEGVAVEGSDGGDEILFVSKIRLK